MQGNLVERKNLLMLMIFLMAVKFMILPLLSWQSAFVSELSIKQRKLDKLSEIIGQAVNFDEELRSQKKILQSLARQAYDDNDSAQLIIQKDVEDTFSSNGLDISTFNWIVDSPGDVRLLRAKIFFSGPNLHVLKTLWDLSMLPKISRQLGWHYHVSYNGAGELGKTDGNLTLEFYAVAHEVWARDADSKVVTSPAITRIDLET